jgi:hypothetical protein
VILSDNSVPKELRYAYTYLRLASIFTSIKKAEGWCLRSFEHNLNPLPYLRKALVKTMLVKNIDFKDEEPVECNNNGHLPEMFVFYDKANKTVKFHLI